MKKNYDLIFITNLPNFYKLNLYNRLSEKISIFVIFTDAPHKNRNEDYYQGERDFDSISLYNLRKIEKIKFLFTIVFCVKYNRIVIGGWDNIVNWFFALFSPKLKNALVVESGVAESDIMGSRVRGFKTFLKKIFLKQIAVVYASGKLQKALIDSLGFSGEIIITKGVGIFNIVSSPSWSPQSIINKFIYVGRLSPEKNLSFLIEFFNHRPDLQLNIVGFGQMEDNLKKMAHDNVIFHGAVNNKDLSEYYQSNHVFILPSIYEPWGLVVEEAMNNGLPVIVSNHVGCIEEVVISGTNGEIFSLDESGSLQQAVEKIIDKDYYNTLRKNVCSMNFYEIAQMQVNCYLKKNIK